MPKYRVYGLWYRGVGLAVYIRKFHFIFSIDLGMIFFLDTPTKDFWAHLYCCNLFFSTCPKGMCSSDFVCDNALLQCVVMFDMLLVFLHKNETRFGNFSPLCDEYNSDNITDRAS